MMQLLHTAVRCAALALIIVIPLYAIQHSANANMDTAHVSATSVAKTEDRLDTTKLYDYASLEQNLLPKLDPHARVLVVLGSDLLERQCMFHGAVAEVSNQDDAGVAVFFQNIVNRVVENRPDFGGDTICGVVHKIAYPKGKLVRQYSGVTEDEADWHPKYADDYLRMRRLLGEYLDGLLVVPAGFESVEYYLNPCLTDKDNLRKFNTHYVFLARHEQHDAYREPKTNEQPSKQIIPAPECKPGYGRVALKAQEHVAPKKEAPQPGLLVRIFSGGATKTAVKDKKPSKKPG